MGDQFPFLYFFHDSGHVAVTVLKEICMTNSWCLYMKQNWRSRDRFLLWFLPTFGGDKVSVLTMHIHTNLRGRSGHLQSPGWLPILPRLDVWIGEFADSDESIVIHDPGYPYWDQVSQYENQNQTLLNIKDYIKYKTKELPWRHHFAFIFVILYIMTDCLRNTKCLLLNAEKNACYTLSKHSL